jgi:hypothetical protein
MQSIIIVRLALIFEILLITARIPPFGYSSKEPIFTDIPFILRGRMSSPAHRTSSAKTSS